MSLGSTQPVPNFHNGTGGGKSNGLCDHRFGCQARLMPLGSMSIDFLGTKAAHSSGDRVMKTAFLADGVWTADDCARCFHEGNGGVEGAARPFRSRNCPSPRKRKSGMAVIKLVDFYKKVAYSATIL